MITVNTGSKVHFPYSSNKSICVLINNNCMYLADDISTVLGYGYKVISQSSTTLDSYIVTIVTFQHN